MGAPAITLTLDWDEELRFSGRCGEVSLVLDSAGKAGASPVQALAFALAGCMGMDLVHILKKGRHALTGLASSLEAERSPDNPKRITAVRLHYVVRGDVPAEVVERALQLSRDTYCSVWHSLRQDIDFRTSFEIAASA
jgi:putative redox protein